MSGLPQPELHHNAKFVFLSDWDGTITYQDSNDHLVDTLGFGAERRKANNVKVLTGESNFRDEFRKMMLSVKVPYEECKDVLREHIVLDPGFLEFYTWCKENGIPLIIVSSGMAPIIRAVLEKLVGVDEASQMEVIANDVKYTDAAGMGETWDIVYRHPESGFGHDKSQSIIPYRSIPSRPTLFFAGDGVSDLSAARHADLLFTKVKPEGNTELATFCDREGIPHVNFLNFHKVLALVKEVVAGKSTEQVIKENQ